MPNTLRSHVPGWLVLAASGAVVLLITAIAVATRVEKREVAPPPVAGPAMRVPLFVDPNQVVHEPRFRFTFDPPEALIELRHRERLDSVVAGAAGDLDRFRSLTAWARAQFEPGIPNPYPPLDARIILRDVRSGFTGGFCAQYNFVLGQALMSLGYPSRYVTVVDHEVLESWARDEGRWVCLDPLHAATYVDEEGRALSVYELCERSRAGKPIIPAEGSLPGTASEVSRAFEEFSVWIRNDHVSRPLNFSDLDRYKVTYIFDGEDLRAVGRSRLTTSILGDLYYDPESPP
jgi:hypothetical protein